MRRRQNYLADLQRRRQDNTNPQPETKPPSEMTDAELQREITRLDRELRNTQETAVVVGREEVAARRGSLADVLRNRSRRRRPWK
jgi:hypothetical protein